MKTSHDRSVRARFTCGEGEEDEEDKEEEEEVVVVGGGGGYGKECEVDGVERAWGGGGC